MYIRQLLDCMIDEPEKICEILETQYGSTRKALDGKYVDLVNMLGRQKDEAAFLYLLRRVARCMAMESYKNGLTLNNLRQTRAYLEDYYVGEVDERCHIITLDEHLDLIRCRDLCDGSIMETSFYLRQIAEETLRTRAAYVVLSHNHPSGKLSFSLHDLDVSKQAGQILRATKAHLLDHILVARHKSISLRSHEIFTPEFWARCGGGEEVQRWLTE